MADIARITDFNPRSPHGERLRHDVHKAFRVCDFNPRSPHGERLYRNNSNFFRLISIHAPRTGSDIVQRRRSHQPP